MSRSQKLKSKEQSTQATPVQRQTPRRSVHDEKLQNALQLMRGVVRSPLGREPKRDARIKEAWRSGQ